MSKEIVLESVIGTSWKIAVANLKENRPITGALLFPYRDGLAILSIDYQTDDQRQEFYALVNQVLHDTQPPWLIQVADSWASESITNPPRVRPSRDPARSEALIQQIIDPSGAVIFSRIHFYVRQNGNIIFTECVTTTDSIKSQSYQIRAWQNAGTTN